MQRKQSAFTIKFLGRVNVLTSKVGVSAALIDPNQSPQIIDFNAIWDTGASNSVIDQKVALKLGLSSIDRKQVLTADGHRQSNVYLVSIYLPNNVVFPELRVTDGDILADSGSILIGMDIIGGGDFAITHSGNKTCMSFQMPSSRRIDFVKDIKEIKAKSVNHRRHTGGSKKK